MKKSLFSSIIKDAGEEHPSIKPYTMKEVPLLGVVLGGKDRFPYAHAPGMTDARVGEEQLLKEIEERERYIKQISEKTHAMEKEAYEKGFTQGEKAGKELGEKKFEAVVKSFTEVWEEVKRLKRKKLSKTAQAVLGFKEIARYLDGEYDIEAAKEALKKNTRNFAKRQLTWFRADGRVRWFSVSRKSDAEMMKTIMKG